MDAISVPVGGQPTGAITQDSAAASAAVETQPGAGVLVGPSCENCGRDAQDSVVANNTLLCTGCRGRHRLVAAVTTVVSWALTLAMLWYFIPRVVAITTHQTFLGAARHGLTGTELLGFYLGLVVGVIVHEGAHAVCARGFGLDVSTVALGAGPVLFQVKLGGTRVSVHLMPLAGMTGWRPGETQMDGNMRAAVAFAGPLSNLLLAGVLLAARSYAPAIATAAAGGNLLLFAENLLPRPAGMGSRVGTDGWQMMKNLTRSYWATAHTRRLELAERCRLLLLEGRGAQVFDHLRGEIDRAGGDYPDAEAMLAMFLLHEGRRQEDLDEGFLRSGRLAYDKRAFPNLRGMALNNRAWRLAVGGWPEYMPDAEWAAREALRIIPNNPAVLGTLALVLVRLGRFDEAEAIIHNVTARQRKALARAKGPARDQLAKAVASEHCITALLYARTGRVDAAAGELERARELHSDCLLVPELDQLLALPSQPSVVAPAADVAAVRQGRAVRTLPLVWALPIFVEVATALGLAGLAVYMVLTGHAPATATHGGLLSFHVDPGALVGVLGVVAVFVVCLCLTLSVALAPPPPTYLPGGTVRRLVAQCGAVLVLVFVTPLALAPAVLVYVHGGSLRPAALIWAVPVIGTVLAADFGAVRLLTAGPLRIGLRDLRAVGALALVGVSAPFLVGVVISPATAGQQRIRWNHFWVADATGFDRTVTGVSCWQGPRCSVAIANTDLGTGRQAIEVAQTHDNGQTWSPVVSPAVHAIGLGATNDISCTSAGSCLVMAGAQQLATDAAGRVTGQVVRSRGRVSSDDLVCPTAEDCFAQADSTVKFSRDRGLRWSRPVTLPGLRAEAGALAGLTCAGSSVCWAFGSDGRHGLVDVTTDGGAAWARQASDRALLNVGSMSCPTQTACYAVGPTLGQAGSGRHAVSVAAVLRSRNLGATWTVVDTLPAQSLDPQIACSSATTCLLLGTTFSAGPAARTSTYALVTGDGGAHWTARPLATQGALPVRGTLACTDRLQCAFAAIGPEGALLVSNADGAGTWSAHPVE